ncbi:hypothetical protein ACNSPG_22465 (plasmid) [Brucella pituitosa]|uniref:hypothetical protein n=1 Tax=Brucella pituitosa TaxID=571256 RepID=UPI003C786A54
MKQKYAAYVDRDKNLFNQKVQTAVPAAEKATVVSSGFGMSRPASLMGMMKPKAKEELVSKPISHGFGMKPRPDTSLSLARISKQNSMIKDAEFKRVHEQKLAEIEKQKKIKEEQKARERNAENQSASKMKM